ncbi:PIN domain-containing protein [Pantoea eucalypti]|uniref:PIN domain-containing protein n=3 Tax=Pantoea eucalypti TaxID=470933 RepID=UPI0012985B9F|nr:PIN domain-containing protein [Pantoea eucalypti]QGF25880.1 PIN domain-containing protein [Pantoea eucalypti]
MAFNGKILSNVYNINKYTPKDSDSFFVDTNVWFWLTYSKGIPSNRQYLQCYNQFINSALGKNATLFHSGLSLAELAHIIEKSEREIHEKVVNKKIGTKDFRHIYSNERNAAINEIKTSWLQVESLATQIEISVCEELTNECVNLMPNNTLDGYDLMIHESMKSSGVLNIITDDGDYTTVDGINVYTSNANVLAAAASQNKLAN